MRVPDDLAKAEDAEIIVRIQTGATGKLEMSQKLSEVPRQRATLGRAIRSLLGQ